MRKYILHFGVHGIILGFLALANGASIIPLGDLPGGSLYSYARGVSADGSIVVGDSASGSSGHEAFVWNSVDGMTGLGDLPGGGFFSRANGVSADGSIVVGDSASGSGNEAFVWNSVDGMTGLGDLPGGGFYSYARGVSADGSIVVGDSGSGSGAEAFVWNSVDGMTGLGDLPGGGFFSYANGVSADGSIVVGGSSGSGSEAFVWNSVDGMQSLSDVLENSGVDLTGWTDLYSAEGVSSDGRYVVGYGTYNGNTMAFRAELNASSVPETGNSSLFLGFGFALLVALPRLLKPLSRNS